MKKKKLAFTLIELLAVIIVLAIIALIAVPIIFNLIENAKIKSLENSCYGVIDAVKTNYAENLLNSEDGTVILKGNVKDLTVSGEHPIKGTWEIDNSSNSTDRGIKIKNVKFASMIDYTCTNVNSDGTINSKVMCTKDGEKSNEIVIGNIGDNELSYTEKAIVDFEINEDKCVEFFLSNGSNQEGADSICKGDDKQDFILNIYEVIFGDGDGKDELDFLIEEGVIDPTYVQVKNSCFEYPIKSITVEEFNNDNCKAFVGKLLGSDLTEEEIEQNCSQIEEEFTSNPNIDPTELTQEELRTYVTLFQGAGIVNIDIEYDKSVITGYLCDVGDSEKYDIVNYEINYDNCMSLVGNDSAYENVCKGGTYNGMTADDLVANNYITMSELLENEVISNPEYGVQKLSCFKYLEQPKYDINKEKCITTINNLYSAYFTEEVIETICNGESWSVFSMEVFVKEDAKTFIDSGAIENYSVVYDKSTIVLYRCGVDNTNNMSVMTDVVIPSKTKKIGEYEYVEDVGIQLANEGFSNMGITSVDFSYATNLTTINADVFSNNKISSLDLSKAKKLTFIDHEAFYRNEIIDLNLKGLTNLTEIGYHAFGYNQITSLDLSSLTKLTTIKDYAFSDNKFTSVKIPNSVTTINVCAFCFNSNLTSIEIDNYEGAISGSPWGATNATIKYLR